MKKSIEELALEKEWSALQSDERVEVLASMDRAAYQQLRELLLATKELDGTLHPPAKLRESLLEEMERSSTPHRYYRVLDLRIPLWQAAAAVLVGIVVMGFWKQQTVLMVSTPAAVVQVRDTLVQEKIVWKERIIRQTIVVYRNRDTSNAVPNFNVAPKGVSLGDAPELMGLFTQAEK